jgi:choline dehydrogenase-like flavoprotein
MNFDILIIGGGPAGITLAKHLSDKIKIGIIEKGDLKYTNKRNLNDYGYCTKYGNYPFENYATNFSSVNYFGGNSIVWSGWSMPFDENEVSSWPISYGELNKYYRDTEKFLKLKSFEELNTENNEEYKNFETNDWKINSWQFVKEKDFNRFSKTFGNNVKILLKSEFKKFYFEKNQVEGVVIDTPKEKNLIIKSKYIVLAQGGLQSTKSLLLCERDQKVDMGNENGHLGKFYMEHPHINLGFFYDNNKVIRNKFSKKNFKLEGLFLKNPYSEKIMNGCITFNNESLLLNKDALRLLYMLRVKRFPKNILLNYDSYNFIKNLIKGTCNLIIEKIKKKKFIYARFEQKPNFRSYMEIDKNNKINLNWDISETDIDSFIKITNKVKNYIKNKISEDVYIDDAIYDKQNWHDKFKPIVLGIGHHMGTTMMSSNNKIGVVNENLQLHYRHNVFICSSSVFPTGGVAHPTFTICALAIRLADFLSRKFS